MTKEKQNDDLGSQIDQELKKKVDEQMKQLNLMCKEFAQKIIDEGLMTEVAENAGECLRRKIDTRIFQTKLYNEAMSLRQKCYESSLRDLEIVEEVKKQDDELKI